MIRFHYSAFTEPTLPGFKVVIDVEDVAHLLIIEVILYYGKFFSMEIGLSVLCPCYGTLVMSNVVKL